MSKKFTEYTGTTPDDALKYFTANNVKGVNNTTASEIHKQLVSDNKMLDYTKTDVETLTDPRQIKSHSKAGKAYFIEMLNYFDDMGKTMSNKRKWFMMTSSFILNYFSTQAQHDMSEAAKTGKRNKKMINDTIQISESNVPIQVFQYITQLDGKLGEAVLYNKLIAFVQGGKLIFPSAKTGRQYYQNEPQKLAMLRYLKYMNQTIKNSDMISSNKAHPKRRFIRAYGKHVTKLATYQGYVKKALNTPADQGIPADMYKQFKTPAELAVAQYAYNSENLINGITKSRIISINEQQQKYANTGDYENQKIDYNDIPMVIEKPKERTTAELALIANNETINKSRGIKPNNQDNLSGIRQTKVQKVQKQPTGIIVQGQRNIIEQSAINQIPGGGGGFVVQDINNPLGQGFYGGGGGLNPVQASKIQGIINQNDANIKLNKSSLNQLYLSDGINAAQKDGIFKRQMQIAIDSGNELYNQYIQYLIGNQNLSQVELNDVFMEIEGNT